MKFSIAALALMALPASAIELSQAVSSPNHTLDSRGCQDWTGGHRPKRENCRADVNKHTMTVLTFDRLYFYLFIPF